MSNRRNKVKRLRAQGIPIREIARQIGCSYGCVTHHLYHRPRKLPHDTEKSVVRYVTYLGDGGSTTCVRVPVSVPRLSFLENNNAQQAA